LILVDTHALTK